MLERACDGGFAMACYFQGLNWQDKFYPGSATHELRALKYYNRACNLNLAGGCANEGFLTERLINDVPAARQLGLKACQMGDPAGCHNAGRISLMYLVDGASAPDLGLAASLFTIACNASIAQSCSALQGMRATGRLPAQLPRFAVRPSTPNAGRVLPRSMIDARDARKVREAQASIAQAQQTMSNSASGGYYGSSNPAANWVTVRTYDTRGNYTGSTRESAVWADIMSKVGSTR